MGFLGLTSYYRNFFHFYGQISRPLTNILKKKPFLWIEAVQRAFLALKYAMCSTRILAYSTSPNIL